MIFLIFLVAGFWGGSFIAIKHAVTYVDPLTAATFRVLIAALTLLIWFLVIGRFKLRYKKVLWKIWLTGFFSMGLPFMALFWAEQHVSAGLGSIVNGSLPIWTFLCGAIFIKELEIFSLRKIFGIIIGFAGLLVIFIPKTQFAESPLEIWAFVALVIMVLSYAVATTLNRYLIAGKEKVDFYESLFHQHLSAFLMLFFVSFFQNDWSNLSWITADHGAIFSIAYLGIFSTAIGNLVFLKIIKDWGAIPASTIIYLVPINTLILDWLIYKTYPSFYEWVGFMVILMSVLLIQNRKAPDRLKLIKVGVNAKENKISSITI